MMMNPVRFKVFYDGGGEELPARGHSTEDEKKEVWNFRNENDIFGQIIVERETKVSVLYVKSAILQTAFRENRTFREETAVVISFLPERVPERICSLYQHRDWWSRPDFPKSYGEVPKRTQNLWTKDSLGFQYYLPMAGERSKCYLQGGEEGALELVITSYTGGMGSVEDICLIVGEGTDFYSVADEVWKTAFDKRGIPGRRQRSYPHMFEYLGFCSWDAFYTDINESLVREKCREFTEKAVPVRWLLLDDGWLSVREQELYALEPEREKFPDGFRQMTEDLKKNSMIDHVGVWHAFGGYWGGIAPGSELAADCGEFLYATKNGKLIPHFKAETGFGFWLRWYQYLRSQGIDFVKVDGQSALKNYYRNEVEIGVAAKGSHQGLEAAAAMLMEGNVINCMGMAMENIFNRPFTAVSRNSDDFVPDKKDGFLEHMLQNMYNAVYHSQAYHCDWDMFWSRHKDAGKHALVRAISGGPVYISDKLGETEYEEIAPLIYRDGKILRMERCALPTPALLFQSPCDTNYLALTNVIHHTGAMAFFHGGIWEEEVIVTANPADIHDLQGEEFLIYHSFEKSWEKRGRQEGFQVSLKPERSHLALILPLTSAITPIGLIDKYMSRHPVQNIWENENESRICLREGGVFAFVSEKPVKKFVVNGRNSMERLSQRDGLWTADLSDISSTVLLEIKVEDEGQSYEI